MSERSRRESGLEIRFSPACFFERIKYVSSAGRGRGRREEAVSLIPQVRPCDESCVHVLSVCVSLLGVRGRVRVYDGERWHE